MDWQDVGKLIIAAIGILAAGGLIIRFVFVKNNNSSERNVTQNNNRAGRDVIGGDKIDKR